VVRNGDNVFGGRLDPAITRATATDVGAVLQRFEEKAHEFSRVDESDNPYTVHRSMARQDIPRSNPYLQVIQPT
jgi:hypothetical protein